MASPWSSQRTSDHDHTNKIGLPTSMRSSHKQRAQNSSQCRTIRKKTPRRAVKAPRNAAETIVKTEEGQTRADQHQWERCGSKAQEV